MDQTNHTKNLLELRLRLIDLAAGQPEDFLQLVRAKNRWFTPEFVVNAIDGICDMLEPESLKKWIKHIKITDNPSRIGLIMAGNIPFVGFHDLLCVLVTGNIAVVKLSSQDAILMQWIIDNLIDIDSSFQDQIQVTDQMKGIDALIATGSNNTTRYFDYYFSSISRIIRRNRTSIAILHGSESEKELDLLAEDIFLYFGLGCRNISTLLLPFDYEFDSLIKSLGKYTYLIDHHSYANNHTYHHAILAMNGDKYMDLGHVLLLESDRLFAPPSLVYYQYYNSPEALESIIESQIENIQCIVSAKSFNQWDTVDFGKTQIPSLNDYADNINTIDFLLSI